MQRIVTPEAFVNAFHPLVVEKRKKIRQLFYARKQYTALFLNNEDGILARTAKSLGLGFRREFLNIDAVFAVEGVDSFPAAIEHEHDGETSTEEMTNLANVSIPLKVLITYPGPPGPSEDQLLRRYEGIIRTSEMRNEPAQHQGYLVIFAFDEGGRITWRYHAYPSARFDSLPIPGTAVGPYA